MTMPPHFHHVVLDDAHARAHGTDGDGRVGLVVFRTYVTNNPPTLIRCGDFVRDVCYRMFSYRHGVPAQKLPGEKDFHVILLVKQLYRYYIR